MSAALTRKLGDARARLQAGDAAGARSLCMEVLQRAPRNPDALCLLGLVNLLAGQPRQAVPFLQQTIVAQPRNGAALENLGLAHLLLGEFDAAERVLRNAAALPGAPASVFMRLGTAILHQGRHAEAVAALQRALRIEPHNADILVNLGQALAGMREQGAAREQFEAALRLAPGHGDAMYNLGVICLEREQFDEARRWFERVIALSPQRADACLNLGIVHEKQHRLDDALACFQRALAISPDLAQARNNVARACALQGRLEAAREQYLAALRVAPNFTQAHEGLASVCLALGQSTAESAYFEESHSAVQRATALDPAAAGSYGVLAELYFLRGELDRAVATLENGYARSGDDRLLGLLTFRLRYLCAWEKWREIWPETALRLAQGAELGNPFALLCEPTTPRQQLAYAKRWTHAQFGHTAGDGRSPITAHAAQPRLRIGYLSADFHEHATAYLIAEMLELHDRSRFEIFAYACGPADLSPMRARLRQACEHFVDIGRDPDDVCAHRIRADELNVLVDLKGHTMGARTAILARRPCSVQVNWLGYPGTMGADFIDYVIADNFIIAPQDEQYYAERVLRLPHCYQPNDRNRMIAAPLARAEYGLPEDAFVFCSFNQAYKITPEIFACWMRLLEHVPGSVLWLLDDNRWATGNLQNAARAHNIAPARLVFAPRLPPAQHLARYRVADLALDTFPCVSHTTASDALWGGCLLVGLCGETFAARVSGSILSACNLPELITYTLEDYARLALQLATDEARRNTLRARLEAGRLSAPLFDARAFTRDLERLYLDIAGQARAPG